MKYRFFVIVIFVSLFLYVSAYAAERGAVLSAGVDGRFALLALFAAALLFLPFMNDQNGSI